MDLVSQALLCLHSSENRPTLFSSWAHKKLQVDNMTSSGQWNVDGSDTFYF